MPAIAGTYNLTSPVNTASASDPDGSIVKVEFYQGTTLIGTATSAPYTTAWNNVAQGSYSLTAQATDNLGTITSSSPINIQVLATLNGVYFIQPDHLGTPRLITNDSNQIVWRHLPTTEPFGNSPPEEDPSSTGTSFEFNPRFPGQYADKETNTSYNYFRDYNPQTGAYQQSDPIGLEAGQFSTYAYVNGNPVSGKDPFGLV